MPAREERPHPIRGARAVDHQGPRVTNRAVDRGGRFARVREPQSECACPDRHVRGGKRRHPEVLAVDPSLRTSRPVDLDESGRKRHPAILAIDEDAGVTRLEREC